MERDFLHRSILRTDHFQASLPRLPIPQLEDTLKKYLESQRQILTDAEYDQTVDIVNKFKATEGPGTERFTLGRTILFFAHIFGQIFYLPNSASYFISSGKFRFFNAKLTILK